MTAVEFLAERYNYITWMRNRDEISAGTADEWRAKFLKEAKEMEEQQLNKAWQDGATTAQSDAAKEIEKNSDCEHEWINDSFDHFGFLTGQVCDKCGAKQSVP